jgi:drug/metabolite transporter (DMT)-like permease
LIIVSVSFAVAGQLTLKSAMDQVGRIGGRQVRQARHTVTRVVTQPLVWAGLGLFGISAVFWLIVLSRVPLSLAYPFVGATYIIVVLWARFWRHESVPSLRWLGVSVVALGIVIVGLSFRRA